MNTSASSEGMPSIWHTTIISFPIAQSSILCAAVPDRVDNMISCAIIRRVSHNSPFPAAYAAVASYIHGVFFSRMMLAQIHWVDKRRQSNRIDSLIDFLAQEVLER